MHKVYVRYSCINGESDVCGFQVSYQVGGKIWVSKLDEPILTADFRLFLGLEICQAWCESSLIVIKCESSQMQ